MIFAFLIRTVSKVIYPKEIAEFKKLLVDEHNKFLSKKMQIQESARAMLIIAEDHRYYKHGGVDLKALLRSFIKTYVFKQIQGGSTIEQQLVRVLTDKFDRSIQRKFKEIILASQIKNVLTKNQILPFYLGVAYFGYKKIGYNNALGKMDPISERDIAGIIARLKYPEPQIISYRKKQLLENRTSYIYKKYMAGTDLVQIGFMYGKLK